MSDNFFVITGASGAGRSTLIAHLAASGHLTVEEPGRRIVQEQQAVGGSALPWRDHAAFLELVLQQGIALHQAQTERVRPVFFDRGLPECLGWAEVLGVGPQAHHRAAVQAHRYNPLVFVAPPWPEIFAFDAERQLSLEAGRQAGAGGIAGVKNLHVGATIAVLSFASADRLPSVPDNLTVTRRHNAVSLFQQFAEAQMRAGAPPKGMEQAFAQQLQISPSMWSQIKSSRPIGDRLARQIEAACGQPAGWLDEEHAPQGLSAGEQQFLALALKAWRSTNADGRKRLKLLLKDVAAGAA